MANRFFPSYDTYIVTSPYGMRTLDGTTKMHNGIDLVAKHPDNYGVVDYITAHTGGTVASVGYNSSAGYYVNIQVSPDTIMAYYHLREQSALKKGDAVKQGDRVGFMGSTGNSKGAHLHWGIKKNGEWINPTPYLDKDYVGSEVNKTVSINMEVLREGSSGEQVKTLQRLLLALGYKMVNNGIEYGVDGSFGTATGNAVEALQEDRKLVKDRIVGTDTWSAILGVSK